MIYIQFIKIGEHVSVLLERYECNRAYYAFQYTVTQSQLVENRVDFWRQNIIKDAENKCKLLTI